MEGRIRVIIFRYAKSEANLRYMTLCSKNKTIEKEGGCQDISEKKKKKLCKQLKLGHIQKVKQGW